MMRNRNRRKIAGRHRRNGAKWVTIAAIVAIVAIIFKRGPELRPGE